MSSIKPGFYTAKPLDYTAGESTNTKTPYVSVQFEINGIKMYWTGYLTEKTTEKTVEQLVIMGFRDKDLTSLIEGKETKALDLTKEVSLTVVEEFDQKGKTVSRIKWINPLRKEADPSMAGKLKALNLEGTIAAVMAAKGVTQKNEEDLAF